jgi:hypothetical protein
MGTQKQYKKEKTIICFKINLLGPKRLQNTTLVQRRLVLLHSDVLSNTPDPGDPC